MIGLSERENGLGGGYCDVNWCCWFSETSQLNEGRKEGRKEARNEGMRFGRWG